MDRLNIKGRLLYQNEPGYEQARRDAVWNGRKPDRYPALLAQVQDEEDVIACVNYAREHGLRIGIRAGGHSWAGWSVREGALLLDLSLLKEMELDEQTGIVRAQPGVLGGMELNPYLEARGRFFNGGHCPTVGIGGFLLQGGQGWNCRGWGWAAESVVGVDVVTADGRLIHASETEYGDLFWAARGAGPGFFGVVTRFHIRTRPLFGALTHTTLIFDHAQYGPVMGWLQEIHGTLDPSIELVALNLRVDFPAGHSHAGKHVLLVKGLAFTDTPEEGRRVLAPLDTCPVVDQALVHESGQPTSMEVERAEQLRQNKQGNRYAVDNAWIVGPPGEVLPALRNAFTTTPTPDTYVLWFSMAPLRELPDMAMSLQTEIYVSLYTSWEDERDDDRCRAWLADRIGEVARVSTGLYLGDSDFQVRPSRFVRDDHYPRLEAIRRKYDPQGLFHAYLGQHAHELAATGD